MLSGAVAHCTLFESRHRGVGVSTVFTLRVSGIGGSCTGWTLADESLVDEAQTSLIEMADTNAVLVGVRGGPERVDASRNRLWSLRAVVSHLADIVS